MTPAQHRPGAVRLFHHQPELGGEPNTATGGDLAQVISQVDYFGNPFASYFISDPDPTKPTFTAYVPGGAQSNLLPFAANGITYNPTPSFVGRGFSYPDPAYSNAGFNQNVITGMKAAFADFIKLRHGGTNFLFGHQAPYTVPGSSVLFAPIWPDKPYRSLSYPDVDYTIMRPATPVPAVIQGALTFPPPYQYDLVAGNSSPIQSVTNANNAIPNPPLPTSGGSYIGDPGVRFPWLDLTFANMGNYNAGYNAPLTTPMIPPIPPRRLFQPPDSSNNSNASTKGDTNLNGAGGLANAFLADPYSELISPNLDPTTSSPWTNFVPQPPNATAYNPSQLQNGTNYKQQDFFLTNNRQHPYYRTELLQKVMNLTTVRTHQFAVWITVGFFEVTHTGTPELGIADILGAELGVAAGNNVRYRSFFVIDRTRATGFNPYYPGDFRDCVTYRRRIE